MCFLSGSYCGWVMNEFTWDTIVDREMCVSVCFSPWIISKNPFFATSDIRGRKKKHRAGKKSHPDPAARCHHAKNECVRGREGSMGLLSNSNEIPRTFMAKMFPSNSLKTPRSLLECTLTITATQIHSNHPFSFFLSRQRAFFFWHASN